jgi:hypothetical protein
MAASLSWIISVIIYDSYETGDIFQLLAAVSWFLSNAFALPEVLTSLYEIIIPGEKRSGGAREATISAAQLAKVDATNAGNDAATDPETTTKTINGAAVAELEMTEKSAAAPVSSTTVAGATAATPAAEDKSTEAATE